MIRKLLEHLPPSIAAALAPYVPTDKVAVGLLAGLVGLILPLVHVYDVSAQLQAAITAAEYALAAWLVGEDPDNPAIVTAKRKP
jgi:hypothetical protein